MDFPVVPTFGFVAFIAVMFFIAKQQAKKRSEGFAAVAEQLGFKFVDNFKGPEKDVMLTRCEAFGPFGKGVHRSVKNLLTGEKEGIKWELFDYEYSTKHRDLDGSERLDLSRYGVVIAQVGFKLPTFSLDFDGTQPEGFPRLLAEADQKTGGKASELIDANVANYLQNKVKWKYWQFGGDRIVLVNTNGHYSAEDYDRALPDVSGFVKVVSDSYKQANRA